MLYAWDRMLVAVKEKLAADDRIGAGAALYWRTASAPGQRVGPLGA